ncbi:NAD(P)/FAD-dependent oxidoreductase [Profundibacter sp.]
MKYDVIVVGGGIIGVMCAYWLVKSGQTTVLLERGEIAQGTTANSFAWANATSKTTDRAYHDLNAMGLAGFHALRDEFGAQALGIKSGGSLQLAEPTDTAGYKSLRDQAAALATFNHPARWINTQELRALEPNLAHKPDAQALFGPDDLCLDAPRFSRFIAGQIRKLGGEVREHCAATTLLATDDGVVTGLTCDAGDLQAQNVLITTGPDTAASLAGLTGYDGFMSGFPMGKVPGLLLSTLPVAPNLLNRLIYGAPSNEVHILPEPSGGIKIGADDMDGMITDDQTDKNLRRVGLLLLERAAKLLPALADIKIDTCTLGVGIRAYPQDGISIAGQMPASKGFYLVATHSGITLAPAIGQLMAGMIHTGQTPDRLKPFALERFAGFS